MISTPSIPILSFNVSRREMKCKKRKRTQNAYITEPKTTAIPTVNTPRAQTLENFFNFPLVDAVRLFRLWQCLRKAKQRQGMIFENLHATLINVTFTQTIAQKFRPDSGQPGFPKLAPIGFYREISAPTLDIHPQKYKIK